MVLYPLILMVPNPALIWYSTIFSIWYPPTNMVLHPLPIWCFIPFSYGTSPPFLCIVLYPLSLCQPLSPYSLVFHHRFVNTFFTLILNLTPPLTKAFTTLTLSASDPNLTYRLSSKENPKYTLTLTHPPPLNLARTLTLTLHHPTPNLTLTLTATSHNRTPHSKSTRQSYPL